MVTFVVRSTHMFFSAHDAVPAHIRIVHQKTNKYQACEWEPNFSKLEQN